MISRAPIQNNAFVSRHLVLYWGVAVIRQGMG